MERRRLIFAASFWKALGDLPEEMRAATQDAVEKFAARSHENSLRPAQKKGLGVWAFRVNDGYRVIYEQEKDSEGRLCSKLIHVGPHDDYRKYR